MPDGDFVNLDWVVGDGPIVVVLPGLQGDLESPHVRGLLRECARRGWRGVLLNYRGRGEPNRLPHSYHCGMTCDLDYLVRLLHRRERIRGRRVWRTGGPANECWLHLVEPRLLL